MKALYENMSSGDHIEVWGVVIKSQTAGTFSIKVEDGGFDDIVIAKLSGKMRQKKIRVMPGDRVRVSITPYDLTKGFITWRES